MALQDSDNFIVGRGDESYKITYQDLKDDLNYVPPPVGTINKPIVLAPSDEAGSNETKYMKSDAITAVEGGGVETYSTKLTVAGPTDLTDAFTGSSWMTDGSTEAGGTYNQTPYKLITSNITAVNDTNPNAVELTFADPCPDLQYFKVDDVVQSSTYTTNKLVIDLGSFSDNFYLEAVYIDNKLLWDSTAFPDAPKNQTTNELVTNYLEISSATSNGTSNGSLWANGKTGGSPNGKVTDTQWRAYNTSAKATIEWTSAISFKDVTLWVSQGSADEVSGEVELSDTTVVANFVIPGNIATFVESEGIPAGATQVIAEPDVANRKLTVDGGEWDPAGATGDDRVEYQTKGGQGNVISVDADNNQILIQDTGDRDNRWIADNQAGTDFYVAGPQFVDEPLLTADVSLESSLFATTPADADTLNKYIWSITPDGGAEMIQETTSNPYTPTGLALGTWHTVTVTHRGNALGVSDPSESTTFKTGSTRNLYTYYKERVELLESRLASIEADEINDDAVDNALLTLIAGFANRIQALEESN